MLPALVWYHNGMLEKDELQPSPLLDLKTNVPDSKSATSDEQLDRDECGGSSGGIRIESSWVLE
jgi:hypothetical protein